MALCAMLLWATINAWTLGTLAPVNMFAERTATQVTAAEIISGRQNGSHRFTPRIMVTWRDGPVELHAIRGSFFDYSERQSKVALGDIKAGDTITVRIIDDRPYADRNDVLRVAIAIWLSIFTIIAFIFAVTMIIPPRSLLRT